jgi:hypothetical protein
MSEGAQVILELLDKTIPAPRRGTRVLDRALAAAGLTALPVTTVELKQFVQSSLRAILEDELGPALAREVSSDLETALSPALRRCDTHPAAPSSKRMRRLSPTPGTRAGDGVSVIVIGGDRLANAGLARALVAEGFEVTTAYDDAELAIVTSARAPDALVLDERSARELPCSVGALITSTPEIAVLAHNCSNPAITDALLRARGAGRMTALPSGISTREVISALSLLAPSARA